jgi:hypothetical protein
MQCNKLVPQVVPLLEAGFCGYREDFVQGNFVQDAWHKRLLLKSYQANQGNFQRQYRRTLL